MKIQSGARPTNLADLRSSYHQAKEAFEETGEQQLSSFDSFEKWGGRASFAGFFGTSAVAGILVSRYAPGLDGYGFGFPVALAGFAGAAAVYYATDKLRESSLSKTEFLSNRSEMVSARDQYREALLQSLSDQGVNDITQPRWEKLKGREEIDSIIPTLIDLALNNEVDDLELLADKRQLQGWQGKLATLQDDPTKFETEFQLVQSHDGLLEAMVDGHGQS